MNIKELTHPAKLEYYSFMWSEARLVVASLALFIGGVPPLLAFNPFPGLYSPLSSLLTLAWIVSGAASAYMLFRWNTSGMKLFGETDQKDKIAFFVSVVSGINLGLTGLMGKNLGMSIVSGRIIFFVVGLLYLATAWHLWQRWNAFGKKMF
ncbi:MAG: hypothetical protein Q7S09_03010 [bacterium]|nr:hypothetical protein [bacterium]